jgi:hypothetical protein
MIAMGVHEYCTEIRAFALFERSRAPHLIRCGYAHKQLSESDARAVVEWILAGAK